MMRKAIAPIATRMIIIFLIVVAAVSIFYFTSLKREALTPSTSEPQCLVLGMYHAPCDSFIIKVKEHRIDSSGYHLAIVKDATWDGLNTTTITLETAFRDSQIVSVRDNGSLFQQLRIAQQISFHWTDSYTDAINAYAYDAKTGIMLASKLLASKPIPPIHDLRIDSVTILSR